MIASVPQDAGTAPVERFPESKLVNNIPWKGEPDLDQLVSIDPSVRNLNRRNDPYQSYVDRTEVFPNQQLPLAPTPRSVPWTCGTIRRPWTVQL